MIAYLGQGDEDRLMARLDSHEPVRHLFPCNLCCGKQAVDGAFLRSCKRGALQFCVVKPACTIAAAGLEAVSLYGEGQWRTDRGYLWVTLIENFSISAAAYYLVLFYLAFKKELAPYKPVPKFLSIKAVLFLSFWQGVLFGTLNYFEFIHEVGSYTSNDVQTALNDFALCFEMLLMACAHGCDRRAATCWHTLAHPTALPHPTTP